MVVQGDDRERALELLAESVEEEHSSSGSAVDDGDPTFLSYLRKRWMLLAFAFFLLLLTIFVGPIGN